VASKHMYDLLEERRLDKKEGIPAPRDLDEIESGLAGVHEFLVGPAAARVVKVANQAAANSITYEEIGRLIIWADHVYDSAQTIMEAAAMVNVAVRESYPLPDGYDGDGTPFDDHGFVEDCGRAEQVARRFGDVYSPSSGDLSSTVVDLRKRLVG
jgi:hypothetical protein